MSAKTLKTPCEIIVWEILPVIRKELAKTLITEHGLTQRKAAERLGLTEATVSRYVAGKRGHTDILNRAMTKELKTAANHILKGPSDTVILETCRLCHLLQDRGVLKQFCE
jgi:uncharacterized protein